VSDAVLGRLLAAGDDGVREAATTGGILLVGAPVVLMLAALLFVLGKYGASLTDSSLAAEARLLTASSAFWARWPQDRLWGAPYWELQAEAARCEHLASLTRARMGTGRYGQSLSKPGDLLHRRLAAYQATHAAVLQAMAYVAQRGQPPR
jgi:hypothetical protein